MTLSQTTRICRWLIRDTFGQALAGRLFWLMLAISGLCIVFCFSVSIDDGGPLHPPDDFALSRPHGYLVLGFGAFRGPLFRDGEAAVHFLQLILAEWVAGGAGILLALIFTAGFLPTFLEPHASAILLAKPLPRWTLLLGKYLGTLAFVAFQAGVFIVGTWLALGLRTGYYPVEYLVCIPLLIVHFAVVYSISVLLAVSTRSTMACVFGSTLFWLLCWAMNCGRHLLVALSADETTARSFPAFSRWMAEAVYWVLPKPADLGIVLQRVVDAGSQIEIIPQFETVQRLNAFSPELSVLTSLLFAVALLAIAAHHLRSLEY